MERHRDVSRDQPTAQGMGRARGVTGDSSQIVSIPGLELLRRIGHGSYGEVWLARSPFDGYRAVKIVHRETFDHERPFERELSGLRSFEPVSRSHEGLIDVLDIGINKEEGYFYYVMELGDDQKSGQNIDPGKYSPKTLARVITRRGRLPVQQCLQLGLTLSLALAELHKHGLVHRDVKPSNIIFVNGLPKLADIGSVAEANAARSYVGTVGFIPPEGPGSPQADIYSLGKVLYEACTGKNRHAFPDLPTRLDERSDSDLLLEFNEVLVQACSNDVRHRYRSALDLHADLSLVADGESIRRHKLLKRRLSKLTRIAAAASLLLAALVAVSRQVRHENRGARESRRREISSLIANGNRAVESGDPLGSLPYFTEALRLDRGNPPSKLRHRLRIGSSLNQCAKLEQVWFRPGEIAEACFSPDGQSVLITERCGKARVFETATGKPRACEIAQDRLYYASYSPDGKLVVTAGGDQTACVWKVRDGACVLKLEHPDQVFSARFSPDGSRIVTACGDHLGRIWDAHTGRLMFLLAGHTAAVLFAGFSHDGRLIVTTARDSTARMWDAADGRSIGPPLIHANSVNWAAFSPDDRKLVTGCLDYKARVWEIPSGKRILPDLDHHDGILRAEFSPDGRWILTASLAGTARLWHADNLLPLGCNPVLSHGVTHACFGPDGRRILTTCSDGTAWLWNLVGGRVRPAPSHWIPCESGERFLALSDHHIAVMDAASGRHVSPKITTAGSILTVEQNRIGTFVLALCRLSTKHKAASCVAQVWNALTGTAVGPGIILSNYPDGITLSENGKMVATFLENHLRLWDVTGGISLWSAPIQRPTIHSAVFSPDGARLATALGTRLEFRDARSGELIFPPHEHGMPIVHTAFSADGSRLIACCSDDAFTKCFARLWNPATGHPVGSPLKHNDGILFAAFSPDGRKVVTASKDFTAIIWDAVTSRQLAPPLQHQHQVLTARFSPDGKWIVTASADKTARIWDAESGDPLTPPFHHPTRLADARFLSNGRRILTANLDGNCWIRELSVDKRPVEDLRMLGELLSGRRVTPSGRLTPLQPESLPALWQRLHGLHPSSFTVAPQEIAAWHEFQARESELEHQWFAAVFHLERLLALRPGDNAFLKRLARAKANIIQPSSSETAPARYD